MTVQTPNVSGCNPLPQDQTAKLQALLPTCGAWLLSVPQTCFEQGFSSVACKAKMLSAPRQCAAFLDLRLPQGSPSLAEVFEAPPCGVPAPSSVKPPTVVDQLEHPQCPPGFTSTGKGPCRRICPTNCWNDPNDLSKCVCQPTVVSSPPAADKQVPTWAKVTMGVIVGAICFGTAVAVTRQVRR